MKKNKRWISFLLLPIAILQIKCSDLPVKKLSDVAVNVEVCESTNFDGSQVISYSGTIEESESIPLSFSTVGNVAKVFVSEGDLVRKGQLLAVLNDEIFKNAYEMSLAAQKQAEDAYNRLLPMYKNGNLPEIKLIEIETSLQQAKAAASIAKKSWNDCKLYSPVDGVVGKRDIDPGMTALPNITSIKIIKIDKVFACVPVSENDISSIKKETAATIKISALDNTVFTGKVKEIGVMADLLAHTYKIKIEIENNGHRIKPGMICNIILHKKGETSFVVVPVQAVLIDEQGKNFVYAVDQNKAIRKYVETGNLLKDGVEVKDGLKSGELIVVAGQQKLVDSSLVCIVKR